MKSWPRTRRALHKKKPKKTHICAYFLSTLQFLEPVCAMCVLCSCSICFRHSSFPCWWSRWKQVFLPVFFPPEGLACSHQWLSRKQVLEGSQVAVRRMLNFTDGNNLRHSSLPRPFFPSTAVSFLTPNDLWLLVRDIWHSSFLQQTLSWLFLLGRSFPAMLQFFLFFWGGSQTKKPQQTINSWIPAMPTQLHDETKPNWTFNITNVIFSFISRSKTTFLNLRMQAGRYHVNRCHTVPFVLDKSCECHRPRQATAIRREPSDKFLVLSSLSFNLINTGQKGPILDRNGLQHFWYTTLFFPKRQWKEVFTCNPVCFQWLSPKIHL